MLRVWRPTVAWAIHALYARHGLGLDRSLDDETNASGGVGESPPAPPHEISLTRASTPLHDRRDGCAWFSLRNILGALGVEPINNFRNVQYYGPVVVGTPGQTLNMVFDTGSSDVWFPLAKLRSAVDGGFRSRTMDCHRAEEVRIHYSIGEVSGNICTDKLTIAGRLVHALSFIAADRTVDLEQMHFDGVFGMAFPLLSHMDEGESPLVQLEHQVQMHSFTFILGDEAVPGDSKLILGPPAEPWLQEDNVTFVPVELQEWWTYLGAIVIGSTILVDHSLFALDTGTSYITLPLAIATKLVATMMPEQGSRCTRVRLASSHMWSCPCEDKRQANVFYVLFNEVAFPIFPEDFIDSNDSCQGTSCECFLQMQSPAGAEEMPIIIGDTFLRTVGSIFDLQQNRIGLAANPAYQPKLPESRQRYVEDKTRTRDGPLLPPHHPFPGQPSSPYLQLLYAMSLGLFLGIAIVMLCECVCGDEGSNLTEAREPRQAYAVRRKRCWWGRASQQPEAGAFLRL